MSPLPSHKIPDKGSPGPVGRQLGKASCGARVWPNVSFSITGEKCQLSLAQQSACQVQSQSHTPVRGWDHSHTEHQASPISPTGWCSRARGHPLCPSPVIQAGGKGTAVPFYSRKHSSFRTLERREDTPQPPSAQKPHWTILSFIYIFYKNSVVYRMPAIQRLPQPAISQTGSGEGTKMKTLFFQHRPT